MAIAIYVVAPLLSGMVPLASDLHYEFAALMALTASLVAGVTVLFRGDGPRHRRSKQGDVSSTIDAPGNLSRILGEQLVLGAIPLVVGILRSFFGTSCGLTDGIVWYVVLVPTSTVVSVAFALVAERFFHRRWLRVLLFLGLWSASLLRGAYEALTGPHIFLYIWQIGLYPGASWEADFPVGTTLLVYQGLHLVAASALVRLLVEISRRSQQSSPNSQSSPSPTSEKPSLAPQSVIIAAIMVLGLLLPIYLLNRADLGLVRTNDWLRTSLGDSLQTPHATIYFKRSGVDSLDLWRVTKRTEYYIALHAKSLKIPEQEIPHIELYIYGSRAEEKEMIGSGSLLYTKPWLNQLHITFATSTSTLRHELSHIMLARWGSILGITPWQGLLEGAAVALEDPKEWRTLEESARAISRFGPTPSLDRLMSLGGFTSYQSTLGYRYAGAFCSWLMRTEGMEKFLRLYNTADFQEVYNRSIEELDTLYRKHLDSLPPPDSSALIVAGYEYGGIPFFHQRCLRRIGALNRHGDDALSDGRYLTALELYERSLGEGINLGARRGVLRALGALGRYSALIDSLDRYAADSIGRSLLPYLVERGDAHWATGMLDSARAIYTRVTSLGIDRWTTIRAAERLWFLDSPEEIRAIMRVYFTRPLDQLARTILLDHAIEKSVEPEDRRILAFMRAALTVEKMPRTTLELLQPFLPSADTMALSSDGPRRIAHDIALWELAIDLMDAELYCRELAPMPVDWKRLEDCVLLRRGDYQTIPGDEHRMRQVAEYLALSEWISRTR